MNDRISTRAGIFESGEKDKEGVLYKDSRLIACRNNKLEDYTVADGTEVVCDRAFMNMKKLKRVTLPASVRAIGESAFSGCGSLSEINIPEGVAEIRQATFRDCDALTAIELPASVTDIEKFAFGRGLKILAVNAPEMKIDKYAFMNARDFEMLMVPTGAADYYRSLLSDCRVKASVEEIGENPALSAEETKDILKPNKIKNMSKAIVHITVPESAKELRCGDYIDFYIAQICDVELFVEDENGDTLYEDDEYQLCPTYSICGYQEALENPDDEDNKECIDDFKNTRFESDSFLKTVWNMQPVSEAEFCRQLVMEATEHSTDVEMELSEGEDSNEPLYVTFEINLPDGEFDVDKLSFINFDMEEGDMECAEIVDNAFTGCDKVLLNFLKYEDTFYPNSGDDDGFAEGCSLKATATVDCDTLEEN